MFGERCSELPLFSLLHPSLSLLPCGEAWGARGDLSGDYYTDWPGHAWGLLAGKWWGGIVGKTCPSLSPGSDSEAPTEPMWYWDHWQARGLVFSMFLGLWYWRGLVRGVMSWWGLVFLFLSCLYVHGSIENVVPDCILVCEVLLRFHKIDISLFCWCRVVLFTTLSMCLTFDSAHCFDYWLDLICCVF